MTRARVAALALVNWKGVFYERYLLDPHVTALEGANGAGKTTVMIAAYVVLLPDMTRLRFTNLGESGATSGDRGIWGRLGELGRPAYCALELALGEQRLVLGVRLTRASEPTVELTPFIVDGLAANRSLSEIFLVRRLDGDHVPELDELKAQVAAVGASIEVFRSSKEYFSALFDRGVTPLRLSSESERGKWNDLLRTSMTGGISRALGSELRSFLLREESGLASTLARMRDNLEACRRTRLEVLESRQLEREISATYEAGLAMFAAALHSARLADAEAEQRVRQSAEQIEAAQADADAQRADRDRLALREQTLLVQTERAYTLRTQLTATRQRRVAAEACAARLAELDAELRSLEAETALVRNRQQACTQERERQKTTHTAALAAYDRASLGLVHMQEGLEELSRRAHAYRQLERRLNEARKLLDRPALVAEDALTVAAELEQQCLALEGTRATLEREGRDLGARQKEHARALELLRELRASSLWLDESSSDADGMPAVGAAADEAGESAAGVESATQAHALARSLLARCTELDLALAQLPRLESEYSAAERMVQQQQAARQLSAGLALELPATAAAAQVITQALTAAEDELQAIEAAKRTDGERRAARNQLDAARQRLADLDVAGARYHAVRAIAERVAGAEPLDSFAALLALRDRLVAQQLELDAASGRLATASDSLQLQAAELARGGVVHSLELLRLRDELGAELLAGRFEDLEPEQASAVEARLGPLIDALVVDDPEAAAKQLAELAPALSAVHFVRAGALLELTLSAAHGDAEMLVCAEPYGVRVARLPTLPNLGRRAREARLAELREQIGKHGGDIEQLAAKLSHSAGLRRDSEQLIAQSELLLGGDPALERPALEAELAALDQRERELRDGEQVGKTRAQALRARITALRRLLPDAALLEGPDYAERAAELAAARARLRAARAELSRVGGLRHELGRLIDVLRTPPPSAAARAETAGQMQQLAQQLDAMFSARSALDEVHALRHAAQFADAIPALDAQQALSPALEQQHAAARSEREAAQTAEAQAADAWEAATRELQTAEAQLSAAAAHRERALGELRELSPSTDEPSELSGLDARSAAAALERVTAELHELEVQARSDVAERARSEERYLRAQAATQAARQEHAARAAAARPVHDTWRSLRAAAAEAGVLQQALSNAPAGPQDSVQLRAHASSKRQLLLDRIARTRGGDELASVVSSSSELGSGYLEAWQAVRAWLGRRVPAQVAEVMDPLLALERLRDHLEMLEGRLTRQETDLRGSSEDVARGIEVQLRRAQAQVRRLNQQLEGIRFGSIHGIRIDLRRIERMEQILKALREGEAQDLLFSASLPIEEALEEIFKRYAGGGRTGGQRLLDYREYVELAVEVRRQAAAAWEPANPTRLSTGEAIGVGAALMMVVLTQWEWDANLLRPRAALGSIRFLFLDEANRLSRDNLGVLFDLCRSLELQLLVAAPEVARADGNTTYRLVRHTTESGHEEVIVSGRRAAPVEREPSDDAPGVVEPTDGVEADGS